MTLAGLIGFQCIPDRFDFLISESGPMPVLDATHLLLSAPQGQGYFRTHILYFHQHQEGKLKNQPTMLFHFSHYQHDLGSCTVNEKDEKT